MNAVSPGLTYIDIHAGGGEHRRVDRLQDSVPMKRGSFADEVARAVMWLRLEDASYVTGTMLMFPVAGSTMREVNSFIFLIDALRVYFFI